jgi:hypothetical protein
MCIFAPSKQHIAKKYETGNQSQRYEAGDSIRTMDEVAHADGDAHQDL